MISRESLLTCLGEIKQNIKDNKTALAYCNLIKLELCIKAEYNSRPVVKGIEPKVQEELSFLV